MTVLLSDADLAARREAANGPLRALGDSLSRDLEPALTRELFVPSAKARMTRRGGRCERDGTLLEFDPFSPHAHRCPRCGSVFDDETHHRWWIMGYQLWLAERAVHAATLFALRGDPRHRDFATSVLDAYADLYLRYPNKDNVLGPTRVFFSTYLESIWLLQLVVALDLLEMVAPRGSFGERVRQRIIEPSAALIASYDEGLSNRQVWNNAALLAASRVLGRPLDELALAGPSGLFSHLTNGLLSDGTWYEGENYHLFAHRGLWYGVTIATGAGAPIDRSLVSRFDEAFATPFVTALPDFTFPSRRDSQYGVSLRQWRFAELAELGLVAQPNDDRLRGALSTLYDGQVARHDTGRSRSTAEAERNTPATALDRSDLGWRSLLFALPQLPPLAEASPESALLPEQGFAILRREDGRLYASLDYGHSGAGHGHPDRLNVVLVHGANRWLDDVGTGSYVDPSLHWYRSTLAHNAPLVNGRSQQRVHGELVAFEDRERAGWVRARVDEVAFGVRFERTVVVMDTYLIDQLSWQSDRAVDVDLPIHADGELTGAGPWTPADPKGGTEAEDGFGFLTGPEVALGEPGRSVRLAARIGDSAADAFAIVPSEHQWWRATCFGAPGAGPARFHFVRVAGGSGRILIVWDVHRRVHSVGLTDAGLAITLRDGARHSHSSTATAWRVIAEGAQPTTIHLGGSVDRRTAVLPRARVQQSPHRIPRITSPSHPPLKFTLGESQYRRSEQSWTEAGKPLAVVSLAIENDALVITVDVSKHDLHFAGEALTNPLDNEHADTNSDGIQLHMALSPESGGSASSRTLDWLMVPDAASDRVRISSRATDGDAPPLRASWHRTAGGYSVRGSVALADLQIVSRTEFRLGVIVNEMSPDRERRRGQLVLGGSAGNFVYLRGDRHAAEDQLAFIVDDA